MALYLAILSLAQLNSSITAYMTQLNSSITAYVTLKLTLFGMSGEQEASSRLYLCVLLRAKPLLAQAVITGLNGSRFLDVYVPDIGVELRVNVDEIVPGPARADWDAQAKCAPRCYLQETS